MSSRLHAGLSGQPPEYLDVVDVLLPPRPAVAQVRVLLLHGEHASDAHGQYRRAIEYPRFIAEGAWREQPVRPSPLKLNRRPTCPPVKVGSAEVGAVPGELACLLWRLSRKGRGASFHKHCLRPRGVGTLEQNSTSPCSRVIRPILASRPQPPNSHAEMPAVPSASTTALMTRSCAVARSFTAPVSPRPRCPATAAHAKGNDNFPVPQGELPTFPDDGKAAQK